MEGPLLWTTAPSLSGPFTTYCPPGSRRSPALDSNSAAPGWRLGALAARSWGARGEAEAARTDPGVCTQPGLGDTGAHNPGARPQARADCSRRRTPASASNALASQARWASEGAPLKSANLLLTPIRPPPPGVGSLYAPGFQGGEASLLSTQVGSLVEEGAAGWVPAASPAALAYLGGELRSRARLRGAWPGSLGGGLGRGRCVGVRAQWPRRRLGAVRGGSGRPRPPARPGLRSRDSGAPQRFPKDQSGAGGWPGGGGKGRPEGQRDAGLDLGGRFLWQPGGRG